MTTIVKEEGIAALWKGHLPAQSLSLVFNGSQFFWFELLTRYFYKKENNQFATNFLCGGTAASLALVVCQPIDVVRTRLISQGEPKIYNGNLDAFKKIYLTDAPKGFYRGLFPAMMLTVPEAAFRFGIYKFLNSYFKYDFIKNKLNTKNKKKNDLEVNYFQSSINGALAGVASKSIVYPFDLIKKRLQIQGFDEARLQFGRVVKFNGLFHCLIKTIREEGFFGMYKGFAPSMMKAALSTSLLFFLYDSLSKFVRKSKIKKPLA